MVRKTIKAIFKRKIKDWVNSIDNEEIKNIIQRNTIITGGAIVSLLQNDKPKDYDIYFRDKESAYKVACYYANKFNLKKGRNIVQIYKYSPSDGDSKLIEDRIKIFISSRGVASEKEVHPDEEVAFEDVYDTELVGDENNSSDSIINTVEGMDSSDVNNLNSIVEYYRPLFFSSNAITLSNNIQIVIRFFGEPEAIHKNYDFIHCTCYWTSWDNNLMLPSAALESILNKQLIYQGSKYPVCSIMRMRKFISRGWTINAGQILKILFQVSELNLTDLSILEEQLVGVDSTYFFQLIEVLEKQKEKNPESNISSTYIGTILDKLFE